MIEVEAGGRVPCAGRVERFPVYMEWRGFRGREAVGNSRPGVGGDAFVRLLWEGSDEAARSYNS